MGYTWDEVKSNFKKEIEILKEKKILSDEEVKIKITNYYN
jgi:hypothetical protein